MSDYFQFMFSDGNYTVTRSNPFKLSVNYCRTNTRKNLFSERVLKVTYCLLLVLIASVLTPLKFPSASEVTALWRYSNLFKKVKVKFSHTPGVQAVNPQVT